VMHRTVLVPAVLGRRPVRPRKQQACCLEAHCAHRRWCTRSRWCQWCRAWTACPAKSHHVQSKSSKSAHISADRTCTPQVVHRKPLVPVVPGVDCVPSYFICGGLVMLPLTIPYLEHGYGGASAANSRNAWLCSNPAQGSALQVLTTVRVPAAAKHWRSLTPVPILALLAEYREEADQQIVVLFQARVLTVSRFPLQICSLER